MTDDVDAILAEVAGGRMSPEAAAARLRRLGSVTNPPRRLRLDAVGMDVILISDQAISELRVDGHYSLERQDGEIRLTARSDPLSPGWSQANPAQWLRQVAEVAGNPRGLLSWIGGFISPFGGPPLERPFPPPPAEWLGIAGRWADLVRERALPLAGFPRLEIRVNPELPITASVTTGFLTARGLPNPLKVTGTAAGLDLTGLSDPIDVSLKGGAARLSAQLEGPGSRFSLEAAIAELTLEPKSSIIIHTQSTTSYVELPRDRDGQDADPGGPLTEAADTPASASTVKVGSGAGRLDLSATRSALRVMLRAEPGS
jgi:hypothetical protein